MTEALHLTPADIVWAKGWFPADVVDEMIADGEFVVDENGKVCESVNGKPKI